MEISTKKNITTYKSELKRMLVAISKYGTGKDSQDIVWLYHFINKETMDIYPILILNQDISPWGNMYYPIKLIMTSSSLPSNIDIYNTESNCEKYIITDSFKISVSYYKKLVPDIVSLDNILSNNISDVLDKSRDFNTNYGDVFRLNKNIMKVIESSKDKFKTVDDKSIMDTIHSELSENTHCNVTTNIDNVQIGIEKTNVLKLFYSISPLKLDKLDYFRLLTINNNEITSTVYLKQYSNNLILHTFYKYIDIWSLIPEIQSKEKTNG